MLEAIKEGPSAYNEWRKKTQDDNTYKKAKNFQKTVLKYFNR
tara:strand:+ start:69 stop:194 length:126 start_codon:yes stop_codon:yes gene_type:complete